MKKMSKKLKKYYLRFYKTGEFRKIEAEDEESARKIAEEKFGESTGNYTIGFLLRNGDKIPTNGINLKKLD